MAASVRCGACRWKMEDGRRKSQARSNPPEPAIQRCTLTLHVKSVSFSYYFLSDTTLPNTRTRTRTRTQHRPLSWIHWHRLPSTRTVPSYPTLPPHEVKTLPLLGAEPNISCHAAMPCRLTFPWAWFVSIPSVVKMRSRMRSRMFGWRSTCVC